MENQTTDSLLDGRVRSWESLAVTMLNKAEVAALRKQVRRLVRSDAYDIVMYTLRHMRDVRLSAIKKHKNLAFYQVKQKATLERAIFHLKGDFQLLTTMGEFIEPFDVMQVGVQEVMFEILDQVIEMREAAWEGLMNQWGYKK